MENKLLLHCCCSPCSSGILPHLSKYFDITLFFYNPCITDKEEYEKRANELKRFISVLNDANGRNVQIIFGEYEPEEFYEIAEGLENEPERGKRCLRCYTQRLLKTAKFAESNGFKKFSTTLSLSPYKDQIALNKIGIAIANVYHLKYFCSDFSYLYENSLFMCKKYGLYEQDYCGCEYSKKYSSELPEV